MIVSEESEDGESSPLYLILITEGALPIAGNAPDCALWGAVVAGLKGAALGGELIVNVAPFLGESCLVLGGVCLLSNDSSLALKLR